MAQITRADIEDGPRVVMISGEFGLEDAERSRDLIAAAMPSTPGHVLLDLTRCDFIDSTALLVVVQAHRRALAGKHRLAIAGSGDQVRRVFELTELDTALPYFRDRESALRFLSRDDVER